MSDNQPTHYAYHVKDLDDKDKSHWTKVGAVWPHKDGKGFNLELELIPTQGGKITVREVGERSQSESGKKDA